MMLILIRWFIVWLIQVELTGTVVYVSDGDTFRMLSWQGEKITIRVEGIDCPEMTQPFGLEAKEFVVKEILDQQVTIQILKEDRYGRKVARVFYRGKQLEHELLKRGLAWHYKEYNQEKSLARLEIKARQSKVGLWSGSYIAPWDYRKGGTDPKPSDQLPSGYVLVCDSKSSKAYHQGYCRGLRRCQAKVVKVTLSQAKTEGRKPCGYCY